MRHQFNITATIFVLFVVAACNFQPKNIWTKEYEQTVYKQTYEGVGAVIKDPVQRKQLALYMVQRLKVEAPYGIYTISEDSLQKLYTKIADDYSKTHDIDTLRSVLKWNDNTEDALRSSLFKSKYLKDESDEQKNIFCNCFISRLKYIYPDSVVTPIPDSVYVSVISECNAENSRP